MDDLNHRQLPDDAVGAMPEAADAAYLPENLTEQGLVKFLYDLERYKFLRDKAVEGIFKNQEYLRRIKAIPQLEGTELRNWIWRQFDSVYELKEQVEDPEMLLNSNEYRRMRLLLVYAGVIRGMGLANYRVNREGSETAEALGVTSLEDIETEIVTHIGALPTGNRFFHLYKGMGNGKEMEAMARRQSHLPPA